VNRCDGDTNEGVLEAITLEGLSYFRLTSGLQRGCNDSMDSFCSSVHLRTSYFYFLWWQTSKNVKMTEIEGPVTHTPCNTNGGKIENKKYVSVIYDFTGLKKKKIESPKS
jgi:hypothetical protein